jgi:hypothetical protein
MLMYYGDGRVLQGILLTLKGNEMRVAVKDADDVAEFRLIGEVWTSELCEPVTFQFPTAIFQAVGIVPNEQNLDVGPDLLWRMGANPNVDVDTLN